MIPYFSYTQIHLGPITLYTWGLFIGLAFLAGYLWALREGREQGIGEKTIFWLSLVIFAGAIVGSRLAYLLQFPARYFSNPGEIFNLAAGGLAFYGGLGGALIFGWLYVKKNKFNFLKIADLMAPAAALGIFIGRIGCFLINDHQGAPANLPWAIHWSDGILRHPVALYLSLNGLILFLILLFLKRKLKEPGQPALVFLIYYAASRFLLDFTRASGTTLSDPRYLNLTISQWISLVILIVILFYLRKRR
ncbi:prolipoprotein diacylglyceryl transferase [Patescibacteria group bacterium]|nr:prolipoprotein diacylglyceryl transferase [Patescibacteria group bacterium]